MREYFLHIKFCLQEVFDRAISEFFSSNAPFLLHSKTPEREFSTRQMGRYTIQHHTTIAKACNVTILLYTVYI